MILVQPEGHREPGYEVGSLRGLNRDPSDSESSALTYLGHSRLHRVIVN